MNELDAVRLHFSPESLVALDVILAFVLFGVALDMRVADFKGILTSPRGTLIGLLAHSVLLPAVAFALTMILRPAPSIALGMILVASCPSGNISNFLVNYGHGNTALSVTIAAFSMLGSIVFTPFNLSFWGELNPHTRPILHAVTPESARSVRHDRGAARNPDRAGDVHGAPLACLRRAHPRTVPRAVARVLRVVRRRRAGRELGFLPQVRRARGAVRLPAQCLRAADGLPDGEGGTPARSRPACRRTRGRHPELRASASCWCSTSSAVSAGWRSSRPGGASGTSWSARRSRPGGAGIHRQDTPRRLQHERPAHFRHGRGGVPGQRAAQDAGIVAAGRRDRLRRRERRARHSGSVTPARRRVRAARRPRPRARLVAVRTSDRCRGAPRSHRHARREVEP